MRRGGEVFIYGSLAGTEFTAPIADLLFGGKVAASAANLFDLLHIIWSKTEAVYVWQDGQFL